MPIFTASLGSVSRTNVAFISRLFACDSSNHYQVLRFPLPSSGSSAKRAALLSPKVTVSSGSAAKAHGVDQIQQQSLSPEDVRQARRSADWKAAQAYNEKGLIYEGRVEGFNEPHKSIQEIAKDLIGSIIQVKVIQADEVNRKLIFSEKEGLWSKFSPRIKVGDIFEAMVGTVEDYGAFVHLRFPDGNYYLTGLVHISEVSWDLVQDASDVLTEGDEVRVKVIAIDRERSRITLSIKQLEEDPLFETLEAVIPQDDSFSDDYLSDNYEIKPLPGLETIIQELQREDGINDVKINRQGFEKRVVSQDLQLWLSNVPPTGNRFTLLARAGRQVQEILLTTSLDQEGIKRALQRVLERVP